MKYASFGSVSSGTMRPEDLIPCFVDTLDSLLRDQPRSFKRGKYRKLIREADAMKDYGDDSYQGLLDELFDALNEFAPPYAYFGAHPGDGADYGFWLSEDFPSDMFDGLRVSDTSEVPPDYRGGERTTDHDHATNGQL